MTKENKKFVEVPDGQRSVAPDKEEQEGSKLKPTERAKAYAEDRLGERTSK